MIVQKLASVATASRQVLMKASAQSAQDTWFVDASKYRRGTGRSGGNRSGRWTVVQHGDTFRKMFDLFGNQEMRVRDSLHHPRLTCTRARFEQSNRSSAWQVHARRLS
jgi:hypothetical protein